MADAKRDNNMVPTLIGVSSVDGVTPVPVYVDPVTHRMLVSISGGFTNPMTTTGDIIYSSDNSGTAARLGIGSTGQFLTVAAGLPAWSTSTITLGGNFTTSGAFTTTLTVTNNTNVTLPTSGTLVNTAVTTLSSLVSIGTITTGTWNASVIGPAYGGTGVANNAANTVTFSGNFALTITLTNTTSVTFPTSGTLVNTAVTTLSSLASIGTITTGVWNGSVIGAAYGGTGVANNAASTITISGNFATTLTVSGTTGVTLPTSGTLATLAGTETLTNKTITSAKFVTSFLDTNGNTLINIGATASAVNYVKITNATTGTAGPILAADGETNVDLKLAGKGTGLVHHTTGIYGDITTDTDGSTVTFNLATSNIHTVTLGGNRTLALSNGAVGQTFLIRLVQDGTGSRTVTWFTTIKWAGGSAPTLTTTAGKADVLGFTITSAGNYDGFVVGANL